MAVNAGGGNDMIILSASYSGNLDGQAGTDTLKLTGGTFTGSMRNFEVLDISGLSDSTAGVGATGAITLGAGATLALGSAESRNASNITLTKGATTSTSSKISLDFGTSASASTTAIFHTLPTLTGTGKVTLEISGSLASGATQVLASGDITADYRISLGGAFRLSFNGTNTIIDSNEAPVISTSGGTSFNVNENQTSAFTALATDANAGATLTYSLEGTDASLFNIGSSSGVVNFKVAPDYESPQDDNGDNIYDITVRVSDGSLSDTQSFTVRVQNLNDNAPVITTSDGTSFNVNENQLVAFRVVASDSDNDPLTYTLSGDDKDLFSINTSGVVSFKVAPDFESPQDDNGDNIYDITVRVSDGSLSDTQSFTVRVIDSNEVPVISTAGGTSFNVVEEQTTQVGTIQATDIESYRLTYSLEGADARFFNIGSSTGILSFIRAMDFENPQDSDRDNIYEIIVRVSDGELSDTQLFRIRITDAVIGDIPLKGVTGTTTGVLEVQTALGELEGVTSLSNEGREFLNKVASLELAEVPKTIAKIIPTEAVSAVTSGITTVATTTNSVIGTRTVNMATGQTQGVRGAMDKEGQILGYNVWADFSMGFGGLDEDANSKGYDFSSYGTRIGIDKRYAEAILGLAFSYSTMSLEHTETGESDLNTFGVTFYNSYTGLEGHRIDFLIGFSSNDIDITGASVGNTSSDLLDLDITLHYLDKDFTSFIGLRYVSNDISSYSLKGDLPMSVAGKAYNSFFIKFGTRCDYYWKGAKSTHNLGLKTSFYYNSSDTERVTSATFVGGTKPFEVRGVEEDKLSLGFGVDYSLQADKMTWVFGYDIVFGQKGNSHRINVKGSWDF